MRQPAPTVCCSCSCIAIAVYTAVQHLEDILHWFVASPDWLGLAARALASSCILCDRPMCYSNKRLHSELNTAFDTTKMTKANATSSKEVVVKFFKQSDDVEQADVWVCRCGKSRKKGNGWSNLMEHIIRHHNDHLEQVKASDTIQISHFFRKRDRNVFSWVEWIVMDLLPWSFCEKDTTRKYSRLEKISIDCLLQTMRRLQVVVEQKIRDLLPSQFAIMFDGWSSGGTHFLAVFAVFPDDTNDRGYNRVLLSFAPLEDEEHLDANSHWDSVYEVLKMYGKNFMNVSCLIADNCATNQSFAKKAKVYFVGCASHRLNLGVKLVLEKYSDTVAQIHKIMVFLRSLKPRAALKKKTHLRPITSNATRW